MLKEFIQQLRQWGMEYLSLYYSNYPARVLDNVDITGKNRLRLYIPTIHAPSTSSWVKQGRTVAGFKYGFQSIPRIGDMITVSFDHGNAEFPKWGYGWFANGEKPEAFESKNVHGFISPGNNQVLIDDENGTIDVNHVLGHKISVAEDKICITFKDGKTLEIDKEVLALNGINQGGLIIGSELVSELQKVNSFMSAIKTVVSVPIPEPGNGAPSVLATALNTSLKSLVNPTYKTIENKHVKHGN